MPASYKKLIVDFLENLKGIPDANKEEFQETIDLLKEKHLNPKKEVIFIPNTESEKEKVKKFFDFLFMRFPVTLFLNKEKVLQLSKDLENVVKLNKDLEKVKTKNKSFKIQNSPSKKKQSF